MILAILYAPPLRRWHLQLADRLEAGGRRVRFEAESGGRGEGGRLVLAVERRLYRAAARSFEPVVDRRTTGEGVADLTIRLETFARVAAGPSLRPLFDGAAGEAALIRAVMRRRAPHVLVQHHVGDTIADVIEGWPANEHPDVLARALDQIMPRVVTLMVQAVGRIEAGSVGRPPSVGCVSRDRVSAASFLATGLAGKLRRKFGPAKGRPRHWRIAYRLGEATVSALRADWRVGAFAPLADDGARFYADPFPFEEDGRRHLFFEDFPYATGKGVIGVVDIDSEGRTGVPRTVLEQPLHLSYPLVIRHAGAIYMLPEMSAARRLQLFRADPYPDRWVPDRVLLEDVVLADATPILHEGRWWVFAAMSEGGESSWDQLCLFHAPDLFGPWTPHRANPVSIDAGAARPAGAMWHEAGVLMRVAQDCRRGYGDGLVLCRVDRLDVEGYAQTVLSRLGPPAGAVADGVHTANVGGGLHVIDLRVTHPTPVR